jgi:GMP synthase (glutamine-hydrolysing)
MSILRCFLAGTEREYGHANVQVQRHNGHIDRLFRDLEDDLKVLMSHGDKLGALPAPFHIIASTKNAPLQALLTKRCLFSKSNSTPRLPIHHAASSCWRALLLEYVERWHWTMAKFVDKEMARI